MPNEHNPPTVANSTLDVIAKQDFDTAIATAHRYPRSVKEFRNAALELATLNETVAAACSYALPRKDRNGQTVIIEGASIRFAEIIGSCWKNAHAATRIIRDDGEFVTAQAVFHDLERNWKIVEEVQRRVVDKHGNRYSLDMVAMTSNAARSIALRNAILHGIPQAFWEDIRLRARNVALGDVRSLESKRAEAIKAFAPYGITEEKILALLGRKGIEDVTIDDLAQLFDILTAIKDQQITPEDAFNPQPETGEAPAGVAKLNADEPPKPTAKPPAAKPKPGTAAAAKEAMLSRGERTASTTPVVSYAVLMDNMLTAATAVDVDRLDQVADLIQHIPDEQQRAELDVEYRRLRKEVMEP